MSEREAFCKVSFPVHGIIQSSGITSGGGGYA